MKNKEIELGLGVDPHRLDEEWMEQPRMFFRYAAKLADARRELDQSKVELELVDAELDLSIRSHPDSFGLAKVTESSLKAVVLTHTQHKDAHGAMLEAKHAVDVLVAAVTGLDHRKKTLENMVSLRLADYYSSPKAPEGARERMEEVNKRSIRRRGRKAMNDG